jgi:hypothetical protein
MVFIKRKNVGSASDLGRKTSHCRIKVGQKCAERRVFKILQRGVLSHPYGELYVFYIYKTRIYIKFLVQTRILRRISPFPFLRARSNPSIVGG